MYKFQAKSLALATSAVAAFMIATPALAGLAVDTPVPLAGAAGPWGLVAAAAAWGIYRLVRATRR